MASPGKRPLKVFLCHASGDKPPVRDLYKRLSAEGVNPWLDKENLLPGQDWRLEIPKAVQEADVVVVCLSNKSVTKEGYVQKEIKFALDIAEEKPEGTIFLIPARLEDCVVPERLGRWHWVDLYEENGFIQLLRSLKLRADAVGATVEPTTYKDSDQEVEHRLDQLYTEGLAAFYTEDWDRACHRFQSILSERPNHKHATEKLAESERQRDLSKLYAQSLEAVRSENWQVAIKTLEELSRKSADYKDAAQLLRNARKQEQLKELYAEAKTLYAAQKWQAVVKVFEQISVIDSTYPDPGGLLTSAQKEVAELKRLADLNDMYSQAVREMDAGQWYEARRLLETVHKSQTEFLETEKLRKKVENEIAREEQKRKQNDQVNTLYEQAHGLLRSKKWRNALDKMKEIHKLDEHFPDVDGIAEKSQKELAREEQEAERQNKLATLYAEAIRLLKEEKYQDALDKWGEVRADDPKYPDRQWVGRTAKMKLGTSTRQSTIVMQKFPIQNMGIGWFILLATVGFGLARLVELNLVSAFRVDLPGELTWGVAGALQGLFAALVLERIEKEWEWRSLPIFGVCWAVVYPMVLWAFREGATLLIASMVFSLAPAASIVLASLWTRRVRQWQTYVLIFIGWILAWMIGLSVSDYINPILQVKSLGWVFRDVLAGGVGLWITVDLLMARSRPLSAQIGSLTDSEPIQKPERLLLLAFLVTVIIRAVWGLFQNWLNIWDEPAPTITQSTFLFLLGGCYGAVVALLLKKVIPGWGWKHSAVVIAGWALGFGMAIFAVRVNLNFDAVVVALWGLSTAITIRWTKPSASPLKLTLIFISWALARNCGSMLGNYLNPIFNTDYSWWTADAVTTLLGLLGTFSVLDGDPKRLVKLSLLCALGFGAGNSLSFLPPIWLPLALAVWGFVGGVIFVSLSRDWKKMLIMGGLCGLGLLLGGIITSFLLPDYGLHNLIWGLGLGIALGLPTRRTSVITFLAILGSAIFMITSVYFSGANLGGSWTSTLRGALIGLVLGFGYAYATRGLKNDKLGW